MRVQRGNSMKIKRYLLQIKNFQGKMCDRKGACLFFRLGTHVGCHDQFNTCTQTQPFVMAPYTVHKDVKHTHRNVRHVK